MRRYVHFVIAVPSKYKACAVDVQDAATNYSEHPDQGDWEDGSEETRTTQSHLSTDSASLPSEIDHAHPNDTTELDAAHPGDLPVDLLKQTR